MPELKTSPYGSWASPITADWIVAGTVGLGQICIDGENVYWNEVRPSEKGRSVVCRRGTNGSIEDVSPSDANVRTRAHEYGGGAFTLDQGTLWYSNDSDRRVWSLPTAGTAAPLTPKRDWRFADLTRDALRGRLIAVCEDHETEDAEPVNRLVAIGDDGNVRTLVEGADFYAAPRISPDGKSLAWLSWDHPNMPWDGCSLWCAQLAEDGELGGAELIAGGMEEAIFQPQFSPDGELFFVSDRSGWWNIYRAQQDEGGTRIAPVLPLEAECGLPQWIFGMSTYGFASESQLVFSYIVDGLSKLAIFDLANCELTPVLSPFVDISGLKVGDGKAVFVGCSLCDLPMVATLEVATCTLGIHYRSAQSSLATGDVSKPVPVTIPVGDGEVAYGFFYPPQSATHVGPEEARPPLIVKSHGGPTGQTTAAFSAKIQFWTSRGFAVLDVNYRGSTGYGRAYRRRLNGDWGVLDVEDCAAGARWLAEKGWVDGERMAISGGSAGGYTTLCALTFEDCFAAGASHYGIGDLSALAEDTHKFESRYLDSLIGPWPDAEETYRARSPIHHTEELSCPVIFLQGLEDKVVPPAQAQAMVAALKSKGIPVAYIPFAEEAHGFRQAANVKRALEGELYFYGRIFDFTPADQIEPVEIENF